MNGRCIPISDSGKTYVHCLGTKRKGGKLILEWKGFILLCAKFDFNSGISLASLVCPLFLKREIASTKSYVHLLKNENEK